jgi:hypothetical protein
MSTRNLARVCAVGCGVVLLAGCSSSSSKTTSTASNNPTPSSSSSPAVPATPASLAQLQKIVLQTAELPASWKGTPYKADPTDSAIQGALVRCVGVRNTDAEKVFTAHSPGFTLGDVSISSSAASYRSQSDIDNDVAMMKSPKLSPCYEQLVRERLPATLPAGATIDSVSLKFTPGSAGGPSNVVATGKGIIKVTVNGKQVAIYQSIAFITGPLIEAQVVTGSFGVPVPASMVNPLVATVAARAAQG